MVPLKEFASENKWSKSVGLGADAGPAAVLGTDVLRQRKRLVLQDGKVFV